MPLRRLGTEDGDRAAVEGYLARRLVECLFLATNLESHGFTDDGDLFQGRWLGWFDEAGALEGVAELLNQGNLLVAVSAPGALEALAAEVAAAGYHPARLMGLRPEVDELHQALLARGEYPVREARDSLLQVLTKETFEPRTGAGTMRPATSDDVPTLLAWKRAFRIQAMGDDPSWVNDDEQRLSLERGIAEQRQFVFEAGGRLVSMARLNARVETMAQLGGVYTPPEERGNGYASRLLSALCERCLRNDGLEALALMVDTAKESANRIYKRLGFLGLGTYRYLLLEPGEAGVGF